MVFKACHTWGIAIDEADFDMINSTYQHQESDVNVDKGINYSEFIALIARQTSYQPGEGETNTNILAINLKSKILDNCSTMREAFKLFDRNNSGTVDKDEMRRVLDAYRIQFNDTELDEIFVKFDKSGDGNFSYGEFVTLFQIL